MNKKQILSVAAGVVMLTACSEYDPGLTKGGVGDYTPADLQLMDKYTENFEARYGKIDENHTWGFGSAAQGAKTRATNPNGNMWFSEGWDIPEPITEKQQKIVRQYFQQHPNLDYTSPGWTNFWVQQVYKGHSETEGSPTQEEYSIGNGTTVVGSEHMDRLVSCDANGVIEHLDKFNNGECTINYDIEIDEYGTKRPDKIMLMENSSTYSFGYNNSNASVYHYDKAALVSWKDIYDWAKEEYEKTGNTELKDYECLNDGWNRSYMGFDWEQVVGENVYIGSGTSHSEWNGVSMETWDEWHVSYGYNKETKKYETQYVKGYADGCNYPTFDFDGKSYRFLITEQNMYACDTQEQEYHDSVKLDEYRDEKNNTGWENYTLVTELLRLGYLPVGGLEKREFAKVATGADGYYSDWIVSLAEAKKEGTPDDSNSSDDSSEKTWYRIMCEDLGNTNDFDFNDLVFDVYFTENTGNSEYRYTAHVEVKAAGGTLPIYLMYNENDAYEAHHLLGCESTSTPINVGIGNDGYTAKEIEIPMKTQNADDITIYVEKIKQDDKLATTTIELPRVGSIASKAPQKICIPISELGENVRWMREMQQIETGYPKFEKWVENKNYGFKWTTTEVNTTPLY